MDGNWEPQQIQIDPKSVRRVVRTATILIGLLIVGTILLSSLAPYTDYLWFVHDVRQPQVFTRGYAAKGLLFAIAFFGTWAVLYLNLRQALNLSLIYLSAPDSPGRAIISHTMKWVQDRGAHVLKFASPIVAFIAASGFSNEWFTFLLAQNGQKFDIEDPMFGMDVGFFVFTLPWLRAITNYLFVLFVITTALTLGLYIGLQALALLARIELSRPKFRLHVSALIAVTLIALALQTWLKTYEYALAESAQFTGAGFVETHQMVIQRGLAVVIALIGVLTLATVRKGKPYSVPMAGGIAVAVLYALGMVIYPALLKRLYVDPDRLEKEGPYAARAIEMTRQAYALDQIEVRDVSAQDRPPQQAIRGAEATLDNLRLWDPGVLRTALETLQGFRPYYDFQDVDIDRYPIAGKQTMVMLAPRDIELDGLEPSARNWTNLRLRYTHGYGVSMTRVDRVTQEGRPVFLAQDIPQSTREGIQIDEPRIYFSDWRNAMREPVSEYALVNTGEPELDYETPSGASTHQWKGDRGVPISGLVAKLAFSFVLGDGNLLVSPNIKGDARLLMRRGVLERAGAVYPFLKFDSDPYLTVQNGRLVWILDGYSTTDMFPYSERLYGLNYMRNSVKATIDAYSGEMHAYAVMPDEPLLKAYRAIYPGLIEDLSASPEGLSRHFRYPEDLLGVQALQLQTYHVDDPTTFLSNSDAWNIASELDTNGQRAPIRPYYVQMQLPDEPRAGFLQILPFTPNKKPNMSGWLAAHCDPETYGRLTMYRFVGTSLVKGPEQMESDFNSTPEISEINRQFNNDQSVVIPGNLLVMPIGNSVMYAEPLFLQSRSPGIQAAPRLAWVVLAFGDRVVVGNSYESALRQLLGDRPASAPTPTTQPSQPAKPTPDSETAAARQALDLLNQAEQAQRNGDWAKYGELQRQLKQKLQELAK